MKRILLKSYCAGIAALALLSSCRDDIEPMHITGDTVNRAYLRVDKVDETKLLNYEVIHSDMFPSAALPEIAVKFPARLTLPARQETKVSIKIDNDRIAAYNEDKGTDYSEIPINSLTLETTTLTIPKGEILSVDSIAVSYSGELSDLTEDAYLVPIVISEVSDPSVQISSNEYYVYMKVTTSISTFNLNPITSEAPEGSRVTDKTGWTVGANKAVSMGSLNNILTDNFYNYAWFRGNRLPVEITIDMKEVYYGITGFVVINPMATYSISNWTIFTATVNGEWTDQGTMAVQSGTDQYASFYKSIDARYIRFEINQGGADGSMVSGFYIYQ